MDRGKDRERAGLQEGGYGVPSELRVALQYGYIHPNLPPPTGLRWLCRAGVCGSSSPMGVDRGLAGNMSQDWSAAASTIATIDSGRWTYWNRCGGGVGSTRLDVVVGGSLLE